MKTITAIAVIAASLAATSAYADRPGSLIRSNVACAGASAPGFTFKGERYIAETAAAYCPDSGYTVVPSTVDVRDLGEVTAWLEGEGASRIVPVLSNGADVCREEVAGECVDFDAGRDLW